MGGAGAIPMNPELLSLAENNDPKSIKILDLIFFPPGNKPYFMGDIN